MRVRLSCFRKVFLGIVSAFAIAVSMTPRSSAQDTGNFQGNTLSAQTGASGNAQPFEFKGARLEMSLEDFKKATARGEVTIAVPGKFASQHDGQ